MKRVRLGVTDLEVSRLCLGTMQFGWTASRAASFEVLDAFAAAGGNFVDTADVYSRSGMGNRIEDSEEILGEWLESRGNRNEFVVATKVRGRMWQGADGEGLSRAHITRAVEDSLRRLRVETIDLYQAHYFDAETPIEETLGAFADLVKAGKVRYVGASNYPPALLTSALETAKAHGLPGFVSLQPHHNLVHRKEFEAGLQPICTEWGLAVIPYSPLAGGFLTGKYTKDGERVKSSRFGRVRQYFTEEGWAVLEVLREVAATHRVTPAAVALAWQMANPAITAPILGANAVEQLADQLPAISLELSAGELARLDEVSAPFRRYGPVHPGR